MQRLLGLLVLAVAGILALPLAALGSPCSSCC